MTRDEHLALSKKRALKYLDRGELANAVTSMGSDLCQRAEFCAEFTGIVDKLMPLALHYVINHDIDGVRRWIVGFR